MSDAVSILATRAIEEVTDRVFGGDDEVTQRAKELQRAKVDALANTAASGPATASTDGASRNAVEELAAEEDCPVCTQLLGEVAKMDEPRRTKGVAEYGEFRSAIEEGGDAAADALRETDVLIEAARSVRL